MKGKLMAYALAVSVLGTGVNWVKYVAGATPTSGSSFTPRTTGGGTWGNGTGGTWSGGSHK